VRYFKQLLHEFVELKRSSFVITLRARNSARPGDPFGFQRFNWVARMPRKQLSTGR
jgi:hypothetical protein